MFFFLMGFLGFLVCSLFFCCLNRVFLTDFLGVDGF